MTIAKQRLEQLSQDPDARLRARIREDEIKLDRMEMRAAKARAEAKGRAELLLRQLGLRFGPVSERVGERVRSATFDELDVWAERVLTAASLREVLDD